MTDYKTLASEYIDTAIDKYTDPLNRSKDFSWDKFPFIPAQDLVDNLTKHFGEYDESFKEVVFKYTIEEATKRIKRGDHLPMATVGWIRKHFNGNKMSVSLGNSDVTIRQWLYGTIEGQSAFNVAKYAKDNGWLEDQFILFAGTCTDPEIQWSLIFRIGHSLEVTPFGIDYENEIVNMFYDIKPTGYTFTKDQNHHLGWFIENAKREGLTELCGKISERFFIDLMLRA